MIARIWHGVTFATQADAYVEFLKRTGLPDYEKTEGNRGVHLLRRIEGDKAHFITLTFWEDEASIKRFAGADFEKARYYPEDADFLLAFELQVKHYEVIAGPGNRE